MWGEILSFFLYLLSKCLTFRIILSIYSQILTTVRGSSRRTGRTWPVKRRLRRCPQSQIITEMHKTKIFGIGLGTLVVGALGIFGIKKFMDSKKDDTASGDDTKNAEKGCGCAKTPKKVVSVKESEYSVNQINPVEVEGQNDIHNAESVKLPSPYMGPQTAHRQNNRPVRNLW